MVGSVQQIIIPIIDYCKIIDGNSFFNVVQQFHLAICSSIVIVAATKKSFIIQLFSMSVWFPKLTTESTYLAPRAIYEKTTPVQRVVASAVGTIFLKNED